MGMPITTQDLLIVWETNALPARLYFAPKELIFSGREW